MVRQLCTVLNRNINKKHYLLVTDLSGGIVYLSPVDQIRSVAQSCPTLCDHMNRSTPGLPVHHQVPEFTQTHVHESVMPSSHLILCRPLLLLPRIPPSIRVFSNEFSSREVAKVLEFQLQHHSFQRNPRADLLQNGLVGCPCSPRVRQSTSSLVYQFTSRNYINCWYTKLRIFLLILSLLNIFIMNGYQFCCQMFLFIYFLLIF